MENYSVYKIINLVNEKLYIGQTIRSIEERFNEHKYENSLIGNAIRKYGESNFTIELIESCSSKEELNASESYWIAELNSKIPNGYNQKVDCIIKSDSKKIRQTRTFQVK